MDSRRPGRRARSRRAISTVVGVALMVVIVAILASVVATMLLGVADLETAPSTETAVSFDGTDTGTVLTPEYVGQEVEVRLNDRTLATIDPDAAGSPVFLPTAPNDAISLVAVGEDTSTLVTERVDADEAGDFVTYYTFDDGGETLEDGSLNENHGTLENDPQRADDERGSALKFDPGNEEYVLVEDITTENVDHVAEFTVAVTFQVHSTGEIQQLVEHHSQGEEWHIETTGNGGLRFAIDYLENEVVETGAGTIEPYETYVAIGTYDGETYRFYLDGEPVGSGDDERDVSMGEMTLGKDHSHDGQYLDGRMYEFRLYYTAFDDHQVEMLTRAMS